MERAREDAWRAVKIDPACQVGSKELAAVHFVSRDFTAFRVTAERAMSLNPRDGHHLGFHGEHDCVLRRLGARRGSGAKNY
jgi:hypothetical protein